MGKVVELKFLEEFMGNKQDNFWEFLSRKLEISLNEFKFIQNDQVPCPQNSKIRPSKPTDNHVTFILHQKN